MTDATISNSLPRRKSRSITTLAALLTFPLLGLMTACSDTLTVQVGGVGNGLVSSAPAGISCGVGGAACTDTTTAGTSLTLTATPSSGSVFAGWGGACSGNNPTCSLTLNANATAVAYFRTTQVSTGAYHTCGLKMDGTVKCWGRNDEGQLGRGTTVTHGNNDVPVAVTNLINAVGVSAGAYHTCVLLVGGAVQCWGRNSEAQVGGGGIDVISAPTPIFQLGSSLAIAAGGYHSCALVIGGTVSCWGYNHDYEIAVLPQDAVVPPATIGGVSGAVAITAGAYHSCALLSNGSADCWGYNHDGETGPSPSPFNTLAISARQVDAATGAGTQGTTAQGGYHTCAVLTAGGTVRCWGYNGHGELGNGSESGPQPVGTATAVIGLTSPVTLVAAGGYHTCAIMAGSVLCWGADESAQLGRGTSGADIPIPGIVSGVPLPPALSVDAGGYHTCAVFSGTADDVRCWGRNTEGQVGRNGTLVLDPVTTPMKLNDF